MVQVVGNSDTEDGVQGLSNSNTHSGVVGTNNSGGFGVLGQAKGANAAVAGVNTGAGAGIFGENRGNGLAGFFKGDVEITGDLRLVNADCAEDFDVSEAEKIEPGTVMVCEGNGALRPSSSSYDRRVVGVVSGAGNYKPAIILDRQESVEHRAPVALMGKVFCNVDADENPIEVGDLLTTASTPGHAMKASDSSRAFGAVIGKALSPLAAGRGKISVLVALQ